MDPDLGKRCGVWVFNYDSYYGGSLKTLVTEPRFEQFRGSGFRGLGFGHNILCSSEAMLSRLGVWSFLRLGFG